MKKVLFSALAVMAVGATVFEAYQTNNEYTSTLFLDSVEALANPTENNSGSNSAGIYFNTYDPCTITLMEWDAKLGKAVPGKPEPSRNYYCTTEGDEEICDEFCNCDDC